MLRQAREEEEQEDEQEDEQEEGLKEVEDEQKISTLILKRSILPKVWDDSENAVPFLTL